MQTRTHAPLPPQPVRVQAKLTVSSAHDTHEQEADRVAEQVTRLPASSGTSAPPPITPLSPGTTGSPSGGLVVPSSVAGQLGQGGGQPLAEPVRERMEQAFGHDFGQVRIYADDASADLSHQARAKAFTHGHDIYFGAGQYQPHNTTGQRLLAHELTHVVQQWGVANPPIARSREDWLTGTPDVSLLPLSQILLDMDEIQQWIDEQISTTPELDRLREAMVELRAEAVRRDAATRRPPPRRRRPRSRRRRTPAEPTTPLPAVRPRILDERSSIEYADRDEMREQFDLIMEWLAHPGVDAADRGILEIERGRLAPEFQQQRVEAAQQRRSQRIQTALVPSDQEGAQLLETLASRIQPLSPDRDDPRIAYLYDQNGRVAISVEQATDLRQTLTRQLRNATRNFRDRTSGYLEQYRRRLELNIDQYIVSGISGLLGGAEFADRAFWQGYRTIMEETLRADDLLQNGQFVEVARLLSTLTQPFEHVRTTVINFDEAYTLGVERAVSGLTFIRDAAFAIDAALATVVAAPFVAGVVGTTGVTGTVLTVGGTGLVVGSGMAVIRGGSGALGVALAGGTWDEVTQAGWDDAKRGFREGFISGASGGAARLLGPAMGVGGAVGQQVLRRIGAEATVNGLATMFDVLWQGGSVEEAIAAGARSAVLSVPAALVGGSQSGLIREVGGPLTAAATVFIDAAARGVPPGEAMQAAAMAAVVNVGTTQATRQRPATPTPRPTPPRPTTPGPVAAPPTAAAGSVPAPDNVIDMAAVRARLRPTTRPTAPQSQPAGATLPIPFQQAANDQLPQALPLAAGAEGQSFRPMASAGGGSRRPSASPTQAPLRSPSDFRPRTTGVDSLPDGPPRTARRQDEPDLVDILESRRPSTARRDVDTPDTDDGATVLPFPSRQPTDSDGLAVGTARQSGVGMAESHHIGSRYQQRIRDLFNAVGLDIEGPANRLLSEEHGQQRGWYQRDSRGRFQHQERGHHPRYHRWVLANLQRARGRGLPVEQSRARVEQMLERLGRIVDSNPEVLQYGDAIFTNRPDMLRPPLN